MLFIGGALLGFFIIAFNPSTEFSPLPALLLCSPAIVIVSILAAIAHRHIVRNNYFFAMLIGSAIALLTTVIYATLILIIAPSMLTTGMFLVGYFSAIISIAVLPFSAVGALAGFLSKYAARSNNKYHAD
ncbi:hypothetical protein SFSGTM_26970 [Sulfuriferula nivalis]|uniref:Uncharacterized protein n=2 Tax=Sulfuriferula nivalis TaxID=2675298 RepID=A0A809RJ89_9PROT|nr:hypothetical protein SFSGTM_26970 [Sulfuriferula nivalis]